MTKQTTYDISFIVILTSICHLLFSKYGFNPTDEGFVLASSNRVLHGQIPHVDFSSVRPLGYAYLHIFELLISKKYFFLISRYVFWLEQISISFLWIQLLIKITNVTLNNLVKYAFILIGFIFNVHYFPASVLHSIDGLLFCLIGLNFILSDKKWNRIGFLFIGFAALCKQNYLILLPFALYLYGKKNWIYNLILCSIPIVIYIFIISIYGGFNDLLTQLTAHNEIIKVGLVRYILNPFLYVGIFIYLLIYFLPYKKKIIFISACCIASILLISNHFHGNAGFIFMGLLIGKILQKINQKKSISTEVCTFILAWSVSISVGYNTPALFIGGILVYFGIQTKHMHTILLSAITILFVIIFYFVRLQIIYKDGKAANLSYNLENVVEGANGIYTNKNTYAVLIELKKLKMEIPNLIALPDFTACSILHTHQSPILTEWPNKTEIPNNKILHKVTSPLLTDSIHCFAIPIYETSLLKDGFILQEEAGMKYPIVRFIKTHFTKLQQPTYFEIYGNKQK